MTCINHRDASSLASCRSELLESRTYRHLIELNEFIIAADDGDDDLLAESQFF